MTDPKAVPATLAQVWKFFNTEGDYKLAQFRVEWALLSDNDRAQLKQGVGDASLTY